MYRKKKILMIISIILTSFSVNTKATLIDIDNYTRDTDTALEWLDLTETVGLTYNEVQAQIMAGEELDGWRYADAAELISLIDSAGGDGVYGGINMGNQWSADNNGVVSNLLEHWGDSMGNNYMHVITDFNGLQTSLFYDSPDHDLASEQDYIYIGLHNDISPNMKGSSFGHALVRESLPIPEPTMLFLITAGLTLIAFTMKKRAQ